MPTDESAPLFKRSSRPKTTLKRPRPPSPTSEQSTPAGDSIGKEEGDDSGVESILLKRKLARIAGLSGTKRGIDVNVLNKGEERKLEEEDVTVGSRIKNGREKDRIKDWENDTKTEEALRTTRRIVKTDNFTQQTNALDVDKHLMAYIESELPKRKALILGSSAAGVASDDTNVGQGQSKGKKDGLYEIQDALKVDKVKSVEGTVSGSFGMLTNIPEVDLGIDNRLKTISETEIAKRALYESRRGFQIDDPELEVLVSSGPSLGRRRFDRTPPPQEEGTWRAQRFYQPAENERDDLELDFDPVEMEREKMKEERRNLEAEKRLKEMANNKGKEGRGERMPVEKATDQMVAERFRKRMREGARKR